MLLKSIRLYERMRHCYSEWVHWVVLAIVMQPNRVIIHINCSHGVQKMGLEELYNFGLLGHMVPHQ